jgi:diamine N-acetyltransferase
MISLRSLQMGDLELVYEWENNPELWSVSEQKGPFSMRDIEAFVEKCLDENNTEIKRLIILLQDHAIGAVDLFEIHKTWGQCGIGIFINDKRHRNRGYATIALQLAISYVRQAGIKKVSAIIYEDNRPSSRLFLAAGFRPDDTLFYNEKRAIRYSLSFT